MYRRSGGSLVDILHIRVSNLLLDPQAPWNNGILDVILADHRVPKFFRHCWIYRHGGSFAADEVFVSKKQTGKKSYLSQLVATTAITLNAEDVGRKEVLVFLGPCVAPCW